MRRFRRLEVKIVITVGFTLLLIFSGLVGYVTWSTKRYALDQAQETIATVIGLFQKSLMTLMRGHAEESLEAFIEEAKGLHGVDELRIVRGEAVVTQFGMREGEGPRDEIEREVLSTGQKRDLAVEIRGHKSFRQVVALRATQTCLSCHRAREGEILGVVNVAISLQGAEQRGLEHAKRLMLITLLTTLLVIVLLFVLLREIVTRRVERLAGLAQAIAGGDLAQRVEVGSPDEIGELSRALNRMADDLAARERALEESNRRLRTLVLEMHHRIKNNLQTVADLLSLEMSRERNVSTAKSLPDSIARIKSIAAVHELLSAEYPELVDIKELVERVTKASIHNLAGPGQRVRASVQSPQIFLPSKRATALALVVNELANNALKHALDGGEREIVIALEEHSSEVVVRVVDDGVGLPPGFDLGTSVGLGLQIARTLVEKELGGTLEMRRGDERGTVAVVNFYK
jgi:two-component sensor histidine kinase